MYKLYIFDFHLVFNLALKNRLLEILVILAERFSSSPSLIFLL